MVRLSYSLHGDCRRAQVPGHGDPVGGLRLPAAAKSLGLTRINEDFKRLDGLGKP